MDQYKKLKNIHKLLLLSAVVISISTLTFFIYVNRYYPATQSAISLLTSKSSIQIDQSDDAITLIPECNSTETGIIFYPGAKVSPDAYSPLMYKLAERGYLCSIARMPFNLAFFNSTAADSIMTAHPEIKHWYISGHSLGGAIAASYLKEKTSSFDGLILLASYSTTDLSQTDLKVLSLYGSQDKVLNHDNFTKSRKNLPAGYVEICIDGGNHAYFGDYGSQKGDGTADISVSKQQLLTVDAICSFLQ